MLTFVSKLGDSNEENQANAKQVTAIANLSLRQVHSSSESIVLVADTKHFRACNLTSVLFADRKVGE